jgi:uncharacterized protein
MDLIEAARQGDEIMGLQEVHPDLFNSLVDNGFLVPAEEDEIEKVRTLMSVIDGADDSFFLMINPTMNCNFKCWYCYESHIKGSKMDVANIGKVRMFIEHVFRDNPRIKVFTISFFGGEPLLYFKDVVVPILEDADRIISAHGAELRVGFTTNGLLIDEDVVAKLSRYTLRGFQISFDGNREHHDMTRFISKNKGSYDEIIRNVKLLVRNGVSITLRINYTAKNIWGLGDILTDLDELTMEERKRVTVSMNKVWQEEDNTLGAPASDFLEKAEAYGFEIMDALYGDTVINSCYADKKNEAVINYNGDLYKCNARDFKKERREGYLDDAGNVVWVADIEERINIKLRNKPCLECSIMPICGGGCSQVAWENRGKDYCVNDFDENKKKDIVLQMFLSKKLMHV